MTNLTYLWDIFFFSSRRRHTSSLRDWSSDVCSSDLVDAGAELILAGHIHQAAVSERHEFEVERNGLRGVTVSVAPGLGQPRPNRRGEARGLHVYEATADSLLIETYTWRDDE